MRLGILISGRGSNFQAIADAVQAGQIPAQIAIVLSNREDAPGLVEARKRGLAALAFPVDGRTRQAYDLAVAQILREHGVELICLAGYMRILTPAFIEAFRGRILNIHPSLLPAFSGLHAQRQALERGVKIAGCTVHWVTEGVDEGPILAQAAVPVLDGDTEETLSARILEQEHRIYPEAVSAAIRRLSPDKG